MTAAEPQAATVRNHWWWRPGWRAGRHFYACHLTLADQPQLRELVGRYQDAIRYQANLDLIPARWLHLTMQGIGFADEISTADLDAVTEHLEERFRAVQPPEATFHRPSVWSEAVVL